MSASRVEMRPKHSIAAALALVLLLIPPLAAARWYQVEVVVFKRTAAATDEQWGELSALPDFSRIVTLAELPADNPPARPGAFVTLSPGNRRLAGVARRLRRSGEYDTVLATAWRQPSYGVVGARRVYLSDLAPAAVTDATGEAPAPTADTLTVDVPVNRQVEGIVAIKISRLMHIEVDFLYYHEGVPVRLQETRKAKLREIHHFDHPLFGLIVQVSPFVLPAVPETAAVGADEPADTDAPAATP